jgi:hypothetical protein
MARQPQPPHEDTLIQAVNIPAMVARARADGWTISYEQDTGNWVGVAKRGRVRLEALADSVPDAIWRVLQKTHLPNLGEVA